MHEVHIFPDAAKRKSAFIKILTDIVFSTDKFYSDFNCLSFYYCLSNCRITIPIPFFKNNFYFSRIASGKFIAKGNIFKV